MHLRVHRHYTIEALAEKLSRSNIQHFEYVEKRGYIKVITILITAPLHPVNIVVVGKPLCAGVSLFSPEGLDAGAKLLHLMSSIQRFKRW